MPPILEQIWEKLTDFWAGLSQKNQIVLIVIVSITVAIVAVLMYWSFQPQWVPLYNRDLAPQEAAQIAAQLEDMGVPHRVDREVVKVPLARVDELRLELAEADVLPETAVGFEIFEKGGIGITNFERQMRYKRALQGSLERSIVSNPDIRDATVNIALPQEEALFKEDEEPVTASVQLRLAPYTDIEDATVDGIVNLVSYGVVGLDRNNVTIMDQHNRVLTDFDAEDTEATKQAQQLEVKRQIENRLERKLQSSLGRVLTRDRMAVAVTVDMDFDEIERQIKEYRMPEGAFEQLRRREQEESRELEGRDLQPGGPAGTESNIPGYEMEDDYLTRYDEDRRMVEYYADENLERIVKDPAVTRMSALVSVDGRYSTEVDEETGEIVQEYEEPSDEEIETIQSMARAAIGYDEERGDQIEVSYLRFDREDEMRRQLEEERQEAFRRRVIYFAAIALGITFFISGLLLLWQRRRKQMTEEEMAAPPEEEPELPARDLMAEVSVEQQEKEQMAQQVKETVDDNPETAAQVLRSWFAEEM